MKLCLGDLVNRMVVVDGNSGGASGYLNVYRADGMRVRKEGGVQVILGSPAQVLGGYRVTRTYYDGQMPLEEDEFPVTGPVDKVTRNFVGGRGLEAMTTVTSSGTDTAYPLYDIHGNMVATLSKSGSGWSLGNQRSYDVWGGVRSGAATGGPKGRYVANLGHVQDDESGLIYMRARYYEPSSGRFISEDPAGADFNDYVYADNSPVYKVDRGGTYAEFALNAINDLIVWASDNPILAGISVFLYSIVKEIPKKLAKASASVVGKWLMAQGRALISSGVNDGAQFAFVVSYMQASKGGGSFGSAMAGAGHALRLGASAVVKISIGYTLVLLGWLMGLAGNESV